MAAEVCGQSSINPVTPQKPGKLYRFWKSAILKCNWSITWNEWGSGSLLQDVDHIPRLLELTVSFRRPNGYKRRAPGIYKLFGVGWNYKMDLSRSARSVLFFQNITFYSVLIDLPPGMGCLQVLIGMTKQASTCSHRRSEGATGEGRGGRIRRSGTSFRVI